MERGRNRAEGWKHGKLSGHDNETKILDYLGEATAIEDLARRCGLPQQSGSPSAEGIVQAKVPSVLGDMTPPKPDLVVSWEDGSETRYSIKKAGGQVFLVTTPRFIDGYEAHYEDIPSPVKEALLFYFGAHPESRTALASVPPQNERIRSYEERKGSRMVWQTLSAYSPELSDALLEWLRSSISNITDFCFSRGLAAQPDSWADFVWYRNLVDDDAGEIDALVRIPELCSAAVSAGQSSIQPGARNGGSVIDLPFGFVQWHQGSMQFHQKPTSVLGLVPSNS